MLFRSYSFVLKFKNKGFDKDDIVQQCRIILCKALDMYNPNNDVLFYSYLLVCLRRGIFTYAKRNSIKNDINYMDIDKYDELGFFISKYDAYENYLDYELQSTIIEFKNNLDFLDTSVFELRYNGFSYKDIASLLEIDVKKVDNTLLKIRKKMEKYFLFS